MTSLPEICTHCNLPIAPADRVVATVNGEELHFCCSGCLGAFSIITGAGLNAFYARRKWESAGTPEGAFERTFNDEYLETFVTDGGGAKEIPFIVSGIRCAACIWLIESILGRTAGVERASINYGTHRGRIRFDPAKTSPARLFQTMAGLGYAPKPFTQDEARAMQEQEGRTLLIRFGTAAFLSMQLMCYSIALYGGYFKGMEEQTRGLLQYFAALVATPVVFFSGAPFLQGAWRSIRNRTPNMDLLVALGVLTAYLYSLAAMALGGEVFFETSAMIITLLLLGRIFENRARKMACSGIDKLFSLAPDMARLIRDGDTVTVTSSRLTAGDVILVGPGERLPVDGVLLDGSTEVDESVLTGEAEPVLRQQNDTLLSGSLNVSAAVRVRVTQTAANSFMARIARMVEEAQNRKASVQRIADRAAGVFIPAVILIALATAGYWRLHSDDPVVPLLYCISVLVVACPCALGLATPTAILVASGSAANRGILFRGGDILEATARLNVAGFDKTGTLTGAFPQVERIEAVDGDGQALLQLAALAESGSSHPLGKSIMARARQEGIRISKSGGTIMPGRGVRVEMDDGILLAGNRKLLEECGVALPANPTQTALTEVHVALAGQYKGCIFLGSRLRPGTAEAVRQIRGLGLETFLLTGDHAASAEKVAGEAGIAHYYANMSPAEKTEWVQGRQRERQAVLMVGDGVNDAPALSAAAVGCAMGGSTDVAMETSDLILMNNDIGQLPEAIRLARKTLRIIRQNLFWAFTYNLVAIPLAATGHLAPMYAAAAMASSSICVVANSLRLRR